MRTKYSRLLFLVFFSGAISAQTLPYYYYHFSELRGITDQSGQTNLFFRLPSELAPWIVTSGGGFLNNIFRFNPATGHDSLFLEDYSIDDYPPDWGEVLSIFDYTFWNNDPSRFIYSGVECGAECTFFINGYKHSWSGEAGAVKKLVISALDSNKIYAITRPFLTSTDAGLSWTQSLLSFAPVSISPFTDNLFIGTDYNRTLFRSTDQGSTWQPTDTEAALPENVSFYYDRDLLHIYRLSFNKSFYTLRVSDNAGIANNWNTLFQSPERVFLNVDASRSGRIWLAKNNVISVSDDYGLTFTPYRAVDRHITGLYAKPGTDTVYATTYWSLFEISPDSVKTLKMLSPSPAPMDWYPLRKGYKWIYREVYFTEYPMIYQDTSIITKEIAGDTLIKGHQYAVIKQNRYSKKNPNTTAYSFQRFDTASVMVYQYSGGKEFPVLDLLAEQGDTSTVSDGTRAAWTIVHIDSPDTLFGIATRRKDCLLMNGIPGMDFTLMKGIGWTKSSTGELGTSSTSTLIGFLKDGIFFGESDPLLGTKESALPHHSYRLSQNYPNPFNPSTAIRYELPEFSRVSMKLYDVLGKEVMVLLNEEKPSGQYSLTINGAGLSSGIYILRMNAGKFSTSQKIILMK